MEYILSRFKIKSGKKNETETFLKKLHNDHQIEMTQVLEEANMTLDCSFVESTSEGDFLYIFKRLRKIEKLQEKLNNSQIKIYEPIRKWAKECLEEGDNLFSIAVFDRLKDK